MSYPGLETINGVNDTSQYLVYANQVTGGIFTPLVLFAFFVVICLGSFFSWQRTTGRGDFVVSFAVAGYVTFGLAIILSLADGLINISTIVTVLVIAIVGTIWLYLSKRNE